jgi:hypothetical protein
MEPYLVHTVLPLYEVLGSVTLTHMLDRGAVRTSTAGCIYGAQQGLTADHTCHFLKG